MTVRRDDLVQIAVTDDHLAAASFERMQVRRVGPDVLRELLRQIALLDKELFLGDRSPIERGILVNPIAIDLLTEQRRRTGRRRSDAEDALGAAFPADPHLAAVRIARTIPNLVHDAGFGGCQASCGIGRSAGLAAHRLARVIRAFPSLLDHAVDDAVEPIACRQSPVVDVLEFKRVESILTELLMGHIVAPAA